MAHPLAVSIVSSEFPRCKCPVLTMEPLLAVLTVFEQRTNIGNARVAGLDKDLGMDDHQYKMTLTIFFISYALAEPVTNVLLKRLTPRVFFTGIILLW